MISADLMALMRLRFSHSLEDPSACEALRAKFATRCFWRRSRRRSSLPQSQWHKTARQGPDEMKWQSQGACTPPGREQLTLSGDPANPGPYTIRLRFPRGYRIPPHIHPDAREVTIL